MHKQQETPRDTGRFLNEGKGFTHLPAGAHTQWKAQLSIWLGNKRPRSTIPMDGVKYT